VVLPSVVASKSEYKICLSSGPLSNQYSHRVKLPKLDQVSGSVVVSSTTDIEEFCKYFDDLKSDGKIDGKESCTFNKKANEGEDGGEESDGSGSSQSNEDDDSAAGSVSINMAVLALAGVAALAQIF
jgi:hypothetical protein